MKFVNGYEVLGCVLSHELVLKNSKGICDLWREVHDDAPVMADRLEIDGKTYYRERAATSGEIFFAKLPG